MKKSQRLRFFALAALAARNEAETVEFNSLLQLAAANPDSSKDVDDTGGNPAAGAKKTVSINDFMARFTALVSTKEGLVTENTGLKQANKELAAGNVGTVTLVAVLTSLGVKVADLAGKDVAGIAAAIKAPAATDASAKDGQIATLTTERDTATATLGGIATILGFKGSDLTASAENLAKFGIANDDAFKALTPAQQTARVVTAAFEAHVSARTLAQVKELGFNAEALPAPAQTATGDKAAALRAEYDELVNQGKALEAGEFYVKNEAAMFGKN